MIFRPEHFFFNRQDNCHPSPHTAAEISNKLFNEWVDKQPVVYGWQEKGGFLMSEWMSVPGADTHRARLCMIEPIVTEHECVPEFISRPVCKICGTHLKMKWERVK